VAVKPARFSASGTIGWESSTTMIAPEPSIEPASAIASKV